MGGTTIIPYPHTLYPPTITLSLSPPNNNPTNKGPTIGRECRWVGIRWGGYLVGSCRSLSTPSLFPTDTTRKTHNGGCQVNGPKVAKFLDR